MRNDPYGSLTSYFRATNMIMSHRCTVYITMVFDVCTGMYINMITWLHIDYIFMLVTCRECSYETNPPLQYKKSAKRPKILQEDWYSISGEMIVQSLVRYYSTYVMLYSYIYIVVNILNIGCKFIHIIPPLKLQ